jgi:DNA-binding GntR family transcriptional regulator
MRAVATAPKLDVKPLDTLTSFRNQAYAALKEAITNADIYAHPNEIRLDERELSQALGVRRTPIREAMTLLEQEGFIGTLPRRGIFIIRKTRREIVEMIQVWAALESLAARLAAGRATDVEVAGLHRIMDEFETERPAEHISEYSDANIAFHQAIIKMSGNQLIADTTENLFIHVRAIRRMTIGDQDRAERSVADHMKIIEALEKRDGDTAARLVLKHNLDLAAHVEKHCTFLD